VPGVRQGSESETARPGAGRSESGAQRAERLARCLERARAGETAALDEVVRELNPLLWHVARAQGLDPGEAYDVVQTTWLELLRRLDQIRSPSSLTAWLVSATRREAWRTNRRRPRYADGVEPVELADGAPGLDEGLITGERDRALWGHFRRLSERCQELLRVVAFVDRPDYAVVSEALGMPHGSIGPTRGRCLAKLRGLLLADPIWSAR
jgi:RNA polymerase sigma factor (sigma-70 family)